MTGIGAFLFALIGALIIFGILFVLNQKYNDLLSAIRGRNNGDKDKKK